MPNTLCHIGIQGPLTGLAAGKNVIPWVILACILPDVPWIVLKTGVVLGLGNPYDLRQYSMVQASLLFCLIISGVLALFASQPGKIMTILSSNCFLHLLLDTLEIKWGNGVHLIAPFSWKLLQLDLFWPEHPLILTATAGGFCFLVWHWRNCLTVITRPTLPARPRIVMAILLFLGYLTGPLLFVEQLEKEDIYSIHTLRITDDRPGKPIAFDRAVYDAGQKNLVTYVGEKIAVVGLQPEQSGRVSFRGHFVTPTSFLSKEYHFHRDYRDFASLVGIIMACIILLQSLILPHFPGNKK